jgi:hypothetical protein
MKCILNCGRPLYRRIFSREIYILHKTSLLDREVLIGILKRAVQGFDGGVAELYPDTHGCILQSCGLRSVP